MDDSVPTAGQTLVIFKKVVLEMSAETFFLQFILLQGVSFEILLFQMAVALNWWGSDPKLVKPKCVWEAVFCDKSKFFWKT